MGVRTKLDAIVSKPESRENHLPEPKSRAECCKESNRHGAEHVYKDYRQGSIKEAKFEDWSSKHANSKCRHGHIRR